MTARETMSWATKDNNNRYSKFLIYVLRQWENVNGCYLWKYRIIFKKKVKYSKEEANNQGPLWAWGGGREALEPASPKPLFDQRRRHQVSSANNQETQLGPWTPDCRGLSQGKYLVFFCWVGFAFQVMNSSWGKGIKEAWAWYWVFFLGRWGNLPVYKITGT